MQSNDILQSDRISTTDSELQKWCEHNNLDFNVIDLDVLINSGSDERYAFIFTGNESTAANNGYKNHWLFLDCNYVFDSYGLFNMYRFDKSIYKPVTLRPKRLQAFNSNVCGQYCALYYLFCKQQAAAENNDESNNSLQFTAYYGCTYDRTENDKNILSAFRQLAP
jgi:hypothetical protein